MAFIESNDELFEQHLSENKLAVVKYYADWCGSCKLFAPEVPTFRWRKKLSL